MTSVDDSDRTSALGLFNTARSYWRSAEQLRSAPPKVTHPNAPVTFLYCHAIELYLKAYLRGIGRGLEELKRLWHHVAGLSKAATDAGLKLEPEHNEILSHIDEADVAIEARYIVTGFKTLPSDEALSKVTEALDGQVCVALSKLGVPVRPEKFDPPKPRSELGIEPEAQRVLVHLFNTGDQDRRGDVVMSGILGLDEGMLKYHLDCLAEAGLAECVGGNSLSGAIYWAITSNGRKFAVRQGLIPAGQ